LAKWLSATFKSWKVGNEHVVQQKGGGEDMIASGEVQQKQMSKKQISSLSTFTSCTSPLVQFQLP
jgi:hypothetical protein